jgi:hypothetical protein
MSIKRSVASVLLGAGIAVSGVAFSTPASADTLAGASLNLQTADDEAPASDDENTAGRFGASLN